MPPEKHAKLGPSGAHRWINCTPSANQELEFEDSTSEAAAEGTAAHALAEFKLKKALGRDVVRPESKYDGPEMEAHTDDYVQFVMESVEEAKQHSPDPLVLVEQRLDLSCYVPGSFGTGDCLIVADHWLHVIDLKYGKGVKVDAEENPQMMLYALGALHLLEGLYEVESVAVTVYQPRRENISTWVITVDNLLAWAKETLIPRAEMAAKGEGDFIPGPWCTFCKAAVKCRARAESKLQLAKYEFAKPPLLSDEEIEQILGKLDDLTKWANEIMAYAQSEAINHGKVWNGYKLVAGKTNRRYSDEAAVIEAVKSAGYTDIFKKSLIPITDMERLLGKKNFAAILGNLITKPQGKPTLVPASDKRPEITTVGAEFDFNDNMEV